MHHCADLFQESDDSLTHSLTHSQQNKKPQVQTTTKTCRKQTKRKAASFASLTQSVFPKLQWERDKDAEGETFDIWQHHSQYNQLLAHGRGYSSIIIFISCFCFFWGAPLGLQMGGHFPVSETFHGNLCELTEIGGNLVIRDKIAT